MIFFKLYLLLFFNEVITFKMKIAKQFLHPTLTIILSCIMFCSCRNHDSRLEYALQASENNRDELEKVLTHYSRDPKDSLKRQAALFLIKNMPEHFSYNGQYLQNFKQAVDTSVQDYLLKKVILMQPARYTRSRQQLQIEADIKHVKADYLIHNIEKAFQQWTTRPWLEGLSFNDFLEYLLPYRIGNETLDYWRDSLAPEQEKRIQEAIQYFDDRKYSVYNISQQISDHAQAYQTNVSSVVDIPFNTSECVFISRLQLLVYRMAGIPAATDHVPCWADMNGFHEWTVVIDPKKQDILHGQLEAKNAPKVFRRTYAVNKIPIPRDNEYVPPFFRDPFNRDVTSKYQATSNITVKTDIPRGSFPVYHAYLAIFNDSRLRIVDWSEIRHGEATFRNLGRGIIYFPVYFEEDNQKNFSYPFILHANGTTTSLRPDKTHLQTVKLTRKYPLHSNKVYHGNALVGANFRCTNDPTFKTSRLVHHVDKNPNMYPVIVLVDTTFECRYWLFDHTKMAELSEWVFKDNRGNIIRGKGIDPIGESARTENIFDGNALSYGRLSRQFIVDFGHPASISEMHYLPRNDANGIYPGNEYELFYFDRDGWQSLGCKIATGYEIQFDSVPAHAVYWLQNHTTGKEERIFTIQDGKQRFW